MMVTKNGQVVKQVRDVLCKNERRMVFDFESHSDAESIFKSAAVLFNILMLDEDMGNRATEDFIVLVRHQYPNFKGHIVLLGSSPAALRANLSFDIKTEQGKTKFKSYLAGIK